MPDSFNIVNTLSSGNDSFDWVQFSSVAIALLALFISIYVVHLSKQTEIRYDKFKKLCLEPICEKIDQINVQLNQLNIIGAADLMNISFQFSNLNILFIQIKMIYPKMDIDTLQNLTIDFTDILYLSINNQYTSSTDFIITKNKILHKVYDFALYKELSYFRLGHR
jgi:hypothetical protein